MASAIILAAGASRRLGNPKQLVRVEGETLLARTICAARASGVGSLFVVLGSQAERIQTEVDLTGVRIVLNSEWERGMASSIRAGIEALLAADPNAKGVMLLVCDQPRLTEEHLRKLFSEWEASDGAAIVASAYGGVTGIPAVFPREAFKDLMALEGDAGARHLLKAPTCVLRTVAFEEGALDIDTAEDLEQL